MLEATHTKLSFKFKAPKHEAAFPPNNVGYTKASTATSANVPIQ